MTAEQALEKNAETFLQTFEAIRRALGLYPPTHPNVRNLRERFQHNVNALRTGTGEAAVNAVAGELYVNGVPLKRLSLTYRRAIDAWQSLGLGHARFAAGLTDDALVRFFAVVRRGGEEVAKQGGMAKALADAGVEGFDVSRVVAGVASAEGLAAETTPLAGAAPTDAAEARSRFQDSIGELAALLEAARATGGDPARMLRSAARGMEARLLERRPVRAWAKLLETHDSESYARALGGAMVTVLVGAALGLGRDRLVLLGEAALLRDVGLTKVPPDAIRAHRKDALAAEEYRRHPSLGAKLLLPAAEVDPSAAIVALEHHAGLDGSGFPRLRARKGLHAFSRIVAVASEYDEAASAPGRTAADGVRRVVQGAGAAHDPAAVRALLRVLGFVPEGVAVRLRDGRKGVVAGAGRKSWLAPQVLLLADAERREVEARVVETDDLAPAGEPAVVRTFPPDVASVRRVAEVNRQPNP